GGLGLGTIVIGLIIAWLLGINPLTLLGMFTGGGTPGIEMPTSQRSQPATAPSALDDEMGKFMSVVLGSTEEVWSRKFQAAGSQYPAPKLVLYRGQTTTACGRGSAAAGPFYCPADRKVYIDLAFSETMKRRLGAPGDFAQAYVLAHEVGHHVQNVTGTMTKMEQARRQMSTVDYNKLSVRLELQADCLAGIWARESQQAKGWLEQGDLEEAMRAAAAVGDDNMMRQSTGVVVPESFTHGSSEQRMRWFRVGLERGDMRACDTFSARQL
ncbi:MAG: neutral zinc metallopeptidase, partial [Burkholderiaceae bacterium]